MKEFDLIEYYFNRLDKKKRSDVLLGIGDDAALLKPPVGELLAVSTDSLVDGVHFFSANIPACDLGYRSLAISLSDMAAMGAKPAWVMLSLHLPSVDSQWLASFSEGFFELVDEYRMELVGGNTTAGALCLNTQVIGFVPESRGVRRSGAKPGDLIYVTGSLGDAGLALHLMQQNLPVPPFLLSRLYRPTPRVEEGLFLRDCATAMIDISDGLVADLQHILNQSEVGARLYVEQIPLSSAMKLHASSSTFAYELALSSGDDYELCFTVSPGMLAEISRGLPHATCIGVIESSRDIHLTYHNKPFSLKKSGYQHFE